MFEYIVDQPFFEINFENCDNKVKRGRKLSKKTIKKYNFCENDGIFR